MAFRYVFLIANFSTYRPFLDVDWQSERPPSPSYLRILYLGKILQDEDTLACKSASFPLFHFAFGAAHPTTWLALQSIQWRFGNISIFSPRSLSLSCFPFLRSCVYHNLLTVMTAHKLRPSPSPPTIVHLSVRQVPIPSDSQDPIKKKSKRSRNASSGGDPSATGEDGTQDGDGCCSGCVIC